MIFCEKCGEELANEAKFCHKCGCNVDIEENSQSVPEANFADTPPVEKEVHINKEKNDMFAWIMALIPLVGTIIGIAIGFGYACLALNIIVGYIDESNLKEQGVDTSEFGNMACIVPYYLYKRAQVLNDSYAYLIVWSVLFAITIFL